METTAIKKAQYQIDIVKQYTALPTTNKIELEYAANSVQQSMQFVLRYVIEMNGLGVGEQTSTKDLLVFIEGKCSQRLSSTLSRELNLMAPVIDSWDKQVIPSELSVPCYEEIVLGNKLTEKAIKEAKQLFLPKTTNEFSKR